MKVKLPNWEHLHMDCAMYWSELFRLNPRLFKRSYSFDDFCRRIHGKYGAYMAKHRWVSDVFKACKLGKTGLYHALAFPEVNSANELFEEDGKLKAHLTAWLRENMLSDLSYYIEAIKREDGILITAKYNQIIGSRWLALLPVSAKLPASLHCR